jgi:hypothetical protein
MGYNATVELRSLVNAFAIQQWTQLYEVLLAKNAMPDILEDVAEIIVNLEDILLVLDGKAN